MIKTTKLSKNFNNVNVVDSINIEVNKGEIFGLLGPNGAGKTTTMKMLSTLLEPSSGEIELMGLDATKELKTIRAKLGYVSQYFGLYEELSVEENINFYASLYGSDANYVKSLIKKYDLERFIKAQSMSLSGGTQRRLSLVCALTHNPELILLDEPTAGVDPLTRKELWDSFFKLKSEGKTLFINTHYMEEALRCDKLAFISEGKIVASGKVEEILTLIDDKNIFEIQADNINELSEKLEQLKDIDFSNQFGDSLRVVCSKEYTQDHLEKDINLKVKPSKATLEDVFISLTRAKDEF